MADAIKKGKKINFLNEFIEYLNNNNKMYLIDNKNNFGILNYYNPFLWNQFPNYNINNENNVINNNINLINNNNNFNVNNFNDNLINQNQFFNHNNNINNINNHNQNENDEENERRRNYGQGARNRGRSLDPMNPSFFNNFLIIYLVEYLVFH